MNKEYLRVQDVAKYLLLSPYSVRRYIKQGKLKAVKVGRSYLVSKSAVASLLKA